MDFITKAEEFINNLLIRITETLVHLFLRLTPQRIIRIFTHFKESIAEFKVFLRNLPTNTKEKSISIYRLFKHKLSKIDYRRKILDFISSIRAFYQKHFAKEDSKIKIIIKFPVSLILNWLQGLTPLQSIFLLSLIAASFLSTLKIISTGNRLVDVSRSGRAPASEQIDLSFDRPTYYKQETKYVMFASIRLPLYEGQINDIKNIDIDFYVTLSNRHTKNILEKLEFQLRDFLILKLEPQIADFVLIEEGREILRKKIHKEIDEFLVERNLNGHVVDVKITYVLAN